MVKSWKNSKSNSYVALKRLLTSASSSSSRHNTRYEDKHKSKKETKNNATIKRKTSKVEELLKIDSNSTNVGENTFQHELSSCKTTFTIKTKSDSNSSSSSRVSTNCNNNEEKKLLNRSDSNSSMSSNHSSCSMNSNISETFKVPFKNLNDESTNSYGQVMGPNEHVTSHLIENRQPKRKLEKINVNTQLKRYRNDRNASFGTEKKKSNDFTTIDRIIIAIRSGNKHAISKLFRKLSLENELTKSIICQILHECLISKPNNETMKSIITSFHKSVTYSDNCNILSIWNCASISFLCEVVRQGRYDIVESFLEAGYNPDFRMVSNCTALMISAYKNDTKMIDILCKYGCDVDTTMDTGATALTVAAFKGSTEAILSLLNNGAAINSQTDDGTTALMIAIKENHIETVKTLIEKNANVNICKKNGSSPIIFAVRYRRDEIIRILSKTKANPDLRLSNGATALAIASANGDEKCVEALLDLGANTTLSLHSGVTALDYACHRGYKSILLMLLQHRKLKLSATWIDRLIKVCSNRNHKSLKDILDFYGKVEFTPFHYAIGLNQIDKVYECLRSEENSLIYCSKNQQFLYKMASSVKCKSILSKAFEPYSISNKSLWPRNFVNVVEQVLPKQKMNTGYKSDLAAYIFSFCGRDWFIKA